MKLFAQALTPQGIIVLFMCVGITLSILFQLELQQLFRGMWRRIDARREARRMSEWKPTVRDKIAWLLANTMLKLASPHYRKVVRASIKLSWERAAKEEL